MSRHLLVTNDFPPKVGGIQNYLFELWGKLSPDSFVVLTSSHQGDVDFDRSLGFEVIRRKGPFLPTPRMLREIRSQIELTGATSVILDPIFPLGLLGPFIGVPFGLVLHGAEAVVPAKLPLLGRVLRYAARRSKLMVCSGSYPERCARELVGAGLSGVRPAFVQINPGVDSGRFRPALPGEAVEIRREFGLSTGPAVLFVSRLVPRKGADTLIEALSRLSGLNVQLWIAGTGRDEKRLRKLASRKGVNVIFLGRVDDESLARIHRSADVFAMLCRDRWFGLEQEGFGIVFVEAAASGVPTLVGRSGGSSDALLDRETGFLIGSPRDDVAVARTIESLLVDESLRSAMGKRARRWAMESLDYSLLSGRLKDSIDDAFSDNVQASIRVVKVAESSSRVKWRNWWIALRRR